MSLSQFVNLQDMALPSGSKSCSLTLVIWSGADSGVWLWIGMDGLESKRQCFHLKRWRARRAIYISKCSTNTVAPGKKAHPKKLTWNLKMNPWKRRFLLTTIIFRFHVSFRGCKWTCDLTGVWRISPACKRNAMWCRSLGTTCNRMGTFSTRNLPCWKVDVTSQTHALF